jgi:protoporphyrinogen/coproporphyrinogen III oxidase
MVFVNLRLRGRNLLSDVVTWTPEAEFPFFRLTEAPRSMPWLAPADKTMITVDIGCEQNDPVWTMSEEALGELCVQHLRPIIPDIRERYLGCRALRTPIAYPVFLKEYEQDRLALQQSTGVAGLHSIGRNGEFAHILMEDVYWRTLRRVRQVITELSTPRPAAAEA